MARKNTGAAGEAAALPVADAQRLRVAVKDMDAMSQEGFGRVAALARVTLMALETPDAYRFTEVVALTLEAIRSIAESSMNTVNYYAGEVGCDWVEVDEQRRMAAKAESCRPRDGGAA